MRFSSKKYAFLIVTLLTGELCRVMVSIAQEPPPPAVVEAETAATTAEQTLDAGEGRKRAKFEYQLDNRPDPFYSFIAKEAKEKKDTVDPIIDENNERLTGMRLFEPGQLRLVAVMGVQGSKIAMAEDTAGKGYILRENILIGKHGKIVMIKDGQVIIQEIRKTQSGREINNEIIMTLKKEEDK
ncbi:MAG: Pilus assembly protein, PilP [Candidatus Electronema aureum]|uniref:Pilus assembly protein, PilP n=1 Tax=Candidatus Electronema aureum TaxID=2005002 RepID=A0A521G3J3_9BACT|nr:MAG: Pilus assembly protein, PilP [Candidatus Electronema aureum]